MEELHAGAVILMGRNVPDPDTTRALCCRIAGAFRHAAVCGRRSGRRHGEPVRAAVPCVSRQYGAWRDYRKQHSKPVAKRLRGSRGRRRRASCASVGVNWNFAPVVDVNCNADNPIIGVRSFGEDAERVAELGMAMMQGYQETGRSRLRQAFPRSWRHVRRLASCPAHCARKPRTPGRDRVEAVSRPDWRGRGSHYDHAHSVSRAGQTNFPQPFRARF